MRMGSSASSRQGFASVETSNTLYVPLACRTFRALMAIAAALDLEIIQLDAANAFLNSDIDEEVYIECPEGFKRPGKVLRLLKALYGLKQAPLLWYQHLLGLTPVPGVACLLTNEGLLFQRRRRGELEVF
jgi:hypothetical protein